MTFEQLLKKAMPERYFSGQRKHYLANWSSLEDVLRSGKGVGHTGLIAHAIDNSGLYREVTVAIYRWILENIQLDNEAQDYMTHYIDVALKPVRNNNEACILWYGMLTKAFTNWEDKGDIRNSLEKHNLYALLAQTTEAYWKSSPNQLSAALSNFGHLMVPNKNPSTVDDQRAANKFLFEKLLFVENAVFLRP